MTRTSFAQVRADFMMNSIMGNFKCIANPYNRGDCPNDLEPEQTDDARRLLRRTQDGMNLNELRDIINCLLCAGCQRTYAHKNKVEEKWRSEFPEFDFNQRRSPSPYSLVSKRRGGTHSRRSSSATPSSAPQATPPEGRHPATYLGTPPAQPTFTVTRQDRTSSVPDPQTTPERIVATGSVLHATPATPMTRALESVQEIDDAADNSPLVERGRRMVERTQTALELSPSSQSPLLQPSLPEDVRMTETPDSDANDDADPESSTSPVEESAVATPASDRFHVGEAFTWSPWTIRSEVLSTLLEPLPSPKSNCSIYAVRVKNTPYVKIGYTTRKKVKTRLTEVAKQQGVDLDINGAYWLPGIPYIQLLRLEAVVHADLAHFQRDLRVLSGRSCRTHREYFEVDVATAQRAIQMWWSIMQDIRLEPGRELDPAICGEIDLNRALAVEMPDAQDMIAEPEYWRRLNSDHQRREHIWKTVFRVDRGGLKSFRQRSIWPWVFGCFLLFSQGQADLALRIMLTVNAKTEERCGASSPILPPQFPCFDFRKFQPMSVSDDDMVLGPRPPALTFDLVARCATTKARAATLHLPHGPVSLPMFMPVATQASLKGLTPKQLEETNCRLCLNNTYHLGLKPGQKTLDAIGGAHKLQSWPHNILTDSGGFQMVSLLKLAQVTEEGVRFLSPHDGTPMLLTPEHSISLQNSIGSDIIMQLDDVIATTSPDHARIQEAMHRSVRWLDRCIAAHEKPESQNLFCIIQGGLDVEMRAECTRQMVARDTPGIAVGGLSGGEAKAEYCKVVDTCTSLMPEKKPRYVMGVGYPEDILVSIALGADMFDCVWPTRTARFGNAITSAGTFNLRHASYAYDFRPVEEGCKCTCCRPQSEGGLGITRAYIHHVAAKETAGAHLLSMHNVHHLLDLMRQAREAIVNDRYPAFLKDYFRKLYAGGKEAYPQWAVDALSGVGIDLIAE